MKLVDKIFGTHSAHEVKKVMPLVDKIVAMRDDMVKLSDDELRGKTEEYKKRYADGESLDSLLPEAFATVREAARRVNGMEHYPVQLIGGIILHQGRISEMRTGEGKTLVATLPSYLNALTGKGVHVVTVNDYLAKRDAEWMGRIHEFLGLTVGCVLNDMDKEERRAAYNCDITYITNSELGFDYLRDNMVLYKEMLVQRGLCFAIIDEVDSILIDEARTPLIISGQSGKSTRLYEVCDTLAKRMERGTAKDLGKMDLMTGMDEEETGDFILDEKDKQVHLTNNGVRKVEQFFNLENYSDPENMEIQHIMERALRANYLMFRDKDYIVRDDEVLIVDEFTGRVQPGRRFSDGLHQSIEAKEHVKIKRETKTVATITYQNFFNKYEKKCGMTGTALTEEREFRDIYGMDVIEIPTNLPVARIDQQDAVYKTKKEKLDAIVDRVEEAHNKKQPVLIGTITIEASETIDKMLTKRGIPHNVLNAKFHELEAQIVAEAGQAGKVTVATNMAGRGTDIKLDDEAKAAGGLLIVGTERHESRRIDNQLRGRSGRQGDPGESKFYISLEDDVMRLFGSERMLSLFNALGVPDGQELQHKMLSSTIEKAQKKIETNHYGIRKNLLDYDQVMNEQREIIYEQRRKVLDGKSMRDDIMNMVTEIVESSVNMVIPDDAAVDEWDMNELEAVLTEFIPNIDLSLSDDIRGNGKKAKDMYIQGLKEQAVNLYEEKEEEFGPDPETFREVERVLLLKSVDRRWTDHIDDMDQLRQSIGLQAYGQKDPLIEYRAQGYDMFDDMTSGICQDTVRMIFHVVPKQEVKREEVVKVTGTNKDESSVRAPKVRATKKVQPNDPCPCGSGKKYKFCCGRKEV